MPLQELTQKPSHVHATIDLLTKSTYAHNKDIPPWEFKQLHIKHLDIKHCHPKGTMVDLINKSVFEPDECGPVHTPSHEPVGLGGFGSKRKLRKVKHSKSSYRMSKFKGI